MFALTALLWVLLTFQIGCVHCADDPVSCDFQDDMCNWRQDEHYDLSDWELTGDGSIIANITDNTSLTLARLISGEFSYGNSPRISVEYKIHGIYNAGDENTKLQVHVMHDGKMTFMTESDISSGSDQWNSLEFMIHAADTCEDSYGELVFEAHVVRHDDWVAVGNVVLDGDLVCSNR